ncbi:hypothetical protein GLAREA_12785 [Glarea lozoyensis ATCC 20868]|uniref:DUF5071 domain-containing protein n=1 Tax=Glarea lozoyensis (strain ATCC 20868 / MF5171) TaxID=1116229 RepID=S3CUH1_GLAL2|nr:uncharacterized protein GLAREA_12785 [Glarea lozoyensis ATCC 20868]EPE30062.1 hypothetical protein GLAREA_12785 [Glarea lozoyensis ATCC 20868]
MYSYYARDGTLLATREFAAFPKLTPEQELLLPTGKHDEKAVQRLSGLCYDELKPLVEFLLPWLQDINWPIALPIAELLRQHFGMLGKLVMDILLLEKNDNTWRNYVLEYIVVRLVEEGELVGEEGEWRGLKGELERLVVSPTHVERDEWDMDVKATEVLAAWRAREADCDEEGDEMEELIEEVDAVD